MIWAVPSKYSFCIRLSWFAICNFYNSDDYGNYCLFSAFWLICCAPVYGRVIQGNLTVSLHNHLLPLFLAGVHITWFQCETQSFAHHPMNNHINSSPNEQPCQLYLITLSGTACVQTFHIQQPHGWYLDFFLGTIYKRVKCSAFMLFVLSTWYCTTINILSVSFSLPDFMNSQDFWLLIASIFLIAYDFSMNFFFPV